MKLLLDDPNVGLVHPDCLEDRYKVVVELTVRAESVDDAQEIVKEIIQYGIIGMIDNDDIEPVEDWDVTEAEPAEVL